GGPSKITIWPERQRSDSVDAEPVGHRDRRQRAKHASVGSTAVLERKKQDFEFQRAPITVICACTRDDAQRFLDDIRDDIGYELAIAGLPEVHERLSLEFSPESRADAGARNVERVSAKRVYAK